VKSEDNCASSEHKALTE